MEKDRTELQSSPRSRGRRSSRDQFDSDYRPAIDSHARKLIARIQRDHLDTEAVLALQTHYEIHDDYPSLANLLEGWARTLRDDRKAAAAYVQAADAVLGGLSDRKRAQKLYQRALERCPEQPEVLAKLEALLVDLADYTALERCLNLLTRDLERRSADAEVRAQAHYRLGQLYETRLLLPGRAISHYRSAVELDPTLVPAIAAARGVYMQSGKAEAAADMYELQIAASSDVWQRHGLLLALAKHRREELSDIDGAVRALRRALNAVPAEPSAIEQLADTLRIRGERGQGPAAHADRVRSAELYYQLAADSPRERAPRFLDACLALQPTHVRAQQLQATLEAPASDAPAHKLDMDDDLAAWLDEKDITLLEEGIGTKNMVPITDRPPPPPPPAPPRRYQTRPQWKV